ncbi:MAG: DUF5312 domain-containing protein [Termitinemataceae bacterium]|nr:MAG: DUF5312 domain-containing protein [Termitinemataceae bacterium]
MAKKDTFESLTSSMVQDDKLKLLEKIMARTELPQRSLLDEHAEVQPAETTDALFQRLSWFKKIIYIIIAFFKGKNSQSVFSDSLIAAEGRAIDAAYPGMYDYQHTLLKQDFQSELIKLKEAVRFFYSALDSSVNKASGDFFVFLGAAEMPEIDKALAEGTDPSVYCAEQPDIPITKLRRNALEFVESTVGAISDDHRNTMYQNARQLICLRQLSSFLFDRLILSFNNHNPEAGIACPVNPIKSLLITLNNILFSLKTTPSITLLSSMFIFIMQEHEGEDGFEVNLEMQKFTERAEKSLDVIRTFNRRIPITRILRCATRDMSLQPVEISGGEDWFAKYRDSWLKKVSEQFNKYIIDNRREHISKLYKNLFGDFKIEPFENVQTNEQDEGVPVDEIQNISILLAFHKKIFMPEINIVLRPILINGEFEKKENRVEFTESYNVLIKLDDTIKNFTTKLLEGGEFGKRWEQLTSDVQSVAIRRRKSQILFEEIRGIVGNIISETSEQLTCMERVLRGILNDKPDKKYESLTNLPVICGKGTTFMDGMTSGLKKLQEMIILVDEIKNIDNVD